MKTFRSSKVSSKVTAVILAITLFVTVFAANAFADEANPTVDFYVSVNSTESSINFRSGAGMNSSIVYTIPNGVVLHITDLVYQPSDDHFWGQTTYNGYTNGWVSLRQTDILRSNGYNLPHFNVTVSSAQSVINFRLGPGTEYTVLMEIPNGTQLYIEDMVYNATDDMFFGKTTYRSYPGYVSLRQTSIVRDSGNAVSDNSAAGTYVQQPSSYTVSIYDTNMEGLALKAEPDVNSNRYLLIPENSIITISQVYSNGWGYTSYNGYSGWVFLKYTRIVGNYAAQTPSYTYASPTFYEVYNTWEEGLELRCKPTSESSTFGPIYDGTVVPVYAIENNWAYVNYNGTYGWCSMGYLQQSYSQPSYIPDQTYNPYGQQSDPYGQTYDPYAQQNSDPYGQTYDPYAQQNSDPYGQTYDPYSQNTNPYGQQGIPESQPIDVYLQSAEAQAQSNESAQQPGGTAPQPADTTQQPGGTASQPADTTQQPGGTASQPADTSSQPAETTQPVDDSSEEEEEPVTVSADTVYKAYLEMLKQAEADTRYLESVQNPENKLNLGNVIFADVTGDETPEMVYATVADESGEAVITMQMSLNYTKLSKMHLVTYDTETQKAYDIFSCPAIAFDVFDEYTHLGIWPSEYYVVEGMGNLYYNSPVNWSGLAGGVTEYQYNEESGQMEETFNTTYETTSVPETYDPDFIENEGAGRVVSRGTDPAVKLLFDVYGNSDYPLLTYDEAIACLQEERFAPEQSAQEAAAEADAQAVADTQAAAAQSTDPSSGQNTAAAAALAANETEHADGFDQGAAGEDTFAGGATGADQFAEGAAGEDTFAGGAAGEDTFAGGVSDQDTANENTDQGMPEEGSGQEDGLTEEELKELLDTAFSTGEQAEGQSAEDAADAADSTEAESAGAADPATDADAAPAADVTDSAADTTDTAAAEAAGAADLTGMDEAVVTEMAKEVLERFNAMDIYCGCASLNLEDVSEETKEALGPFEVESYLAQMKVSQIMDCSTIQDALNQRTEYFAESILTEYDGFTKYLKEYHGKVYLGWQGIDSNLFDLDTLIINSIEADSVNAFCIREYGGDFHIHNLEFLYVNGHLKLMNMEKLFS